MLKVKTGAFVIGISKKNTHILQPFAAKGCKMCEVGKPPIITI